MMTLMTMMTVHCSDDDYDENDDDLLQMPGTGGGGQHGEREHVLICQGHLLCSRGAVNIFKIIKRVLGEVERCEAGQRSVGDCCKEASTEGESPHQVSTFEHFFNI